MHARNTKTNKVIYHQTACFGCNLDVCEHHRMKCIRSITVDEVAQAVDDVMTASYADEAEQPRHPHTSGWARPRPPRFAGDGAGDRRSNLAKAGVDVS